MFEVVAVWDSEIFAHKTHSYIDALQWVRSYIDCKNCKVRIWRIKAN